MILAEPEDLEDGDAYVHYADYAKLESDLAALRQRCEGMEEAIRLWPEAHQLLSVAAWCKNSTITNQDVIRLNELENILHTAALAAQEVK